MSVTLSAYQHELVRQFEGALAAAEAAHNQAHARLSHYERDSLAAAVLHHDIRVARAERDEAEAALMFITNASHDVVVEAYHDLVEAYVKAGGRDDLTSVKAFMAPVMLPEGEAV